MSDYRIVEDTQIQVTNTYKRNKTKRAKLKRNFNFVLQGMMLSSVMLSSTLGVNGGKVFANDLDTTSDGGTKTPEPDSNIQDVTHGIHDEQAKIFNLKNANRVLEAAIKTGQLDKWVYERVMTALIDLDVHLDATQTINNSSAIIDVLMKTEELLSPEYAKKLEVDEQTENVRYSAELSLLSVKETLKELTGGQDVTFDLGTGKPVSKPFAVTASTASVPLQGYSQNDKGEWNSNVDSASSTVNSSSQGPAKVEQAPTIDKSSQGPATKVTIYDDFNPNEYWADNMLWMINQGYITGYIKQKHPTTGKYGKQVDHR